MRKGLLGVLLAGVAGCCFFPDVPDMSVTREAVGTNGVCRIEFTVRSEPGSDIRCALELPPQEKWNGQLWGVGNGGDGGKLPDVSAYSREGSAAVTCDLGTWLYQFGPKKGQAWGEVALHDYNRRATHLMTVFGKRLVEARYGRKPSRCFFFGGSTGGRQGMMEALHYPEDYDGIVSMYQDGNGPSTDAAAQLLWQTFHDLETGRLLFTTKQLEVVADAAVEYRAAKEPKPYAGRTLVNPHLSETDIDGFLALAAKKDPALADPELQRRLKGLYMGVTIGGRRVFHGHPCGAPLVKRTSRYGCEMLRQLIRADPKHGRTVRWDEFDRFEEKMSPDFNACSTDLGPFFARGGKLIVIAGMDDHVCPPADIIGHFERIAAAFGGYEKLGDRCRLFCFHGRGHGGGRFEYGEDNAVLRQKLVDWRERGVAPDVLPYAWKSQGIVIPEPPYPFYAYQDEKGDWRRGKYPENAIRQPDPIYYR